MSRTGGYSDTKREGKQKTLKTLSSASSPFVAVALRTLGRKIARFAVRFIAFGCFVFSLASAGGPPL
jgi:hypothetical protein